MSCYECPRCRRAVAVGLVCAACVVSVIGRHPEIPHTPHQDHVPIRLAPGLPAAAWTSSASTTIKVAILPPKAPG